ncbi:hypothetical protein ScPMuIL_010551 [Solemya velum]
MAAIEKERREQNAPEDSVMWGQQQAGEAVSSTLIVNGDVGLPMATETAEPLLAEGQEETDKKEIPVPIISNKDIQIAEKENTNGSLSSEWTGPEKNRTNEKSTEELEISDEVKSVVNGMTVAVSNTEKEDALRDVSESEDTFEIIDVKVAMCLDDEKLTDSPESSSEVSSVKSRDTVSHTRSSSESPSVELEVTTEIETGPTVCPPLSEMAQVVESDQMVLQETSNVTTYGDKNVEIEMPSSTENQPETDLLEQSSSVQNSEKSEEVCDMKSKDVSTDTTVNDKHPELPSDTSNKIVDKHKESSVSEKPVLNRTVPKARKSCQSFRPSSSPLSSTIIKTVNLLPIANMTFNLPELESALDLGNRTLENTKLTKKGKNSDKRKEITTCNSSYVSEQRSNEIDHSITESNAFSEDSNGKYDDDSVNDPVEDMDVDNLSTEQSTTSELVHSKARPKKRRKKMGTYHLPNEKKKSYKRKKEKEEHSSDFKLKSSRTKIEDMNSTNLETGDSADETISNCSANNMSDLITNDKTEVQPVDPGQCSVKTEKKSVMEVLTQNSHLAFSLGKKSKSLIVNRKSPKSEPVQLQSQSIVHFMKSSQEDKNPQQNVKDQENKGGTVEDSTELGEKNSLRKRKLTDADVPTSKSINESIDAHTNDSSFSPLEGKKQKIGEESSPQVITVLKSPISTVAPVAYRSILPKNLGSILNPVVMAPTSSPQIQNPQALKVKPIPVNIQIANNSNPPTIRLSLIQEGGKIIPGTFPIGQSIQITKSVTKVMPVISTSTVAISEPVSVFPDAKSIVSQLPSIDSPASHAPVLNKLLTSGLQSFKESCDNQEKTIPAVGSSVPNGLSYPVTPPKTPEDSHSQMSTPVPVEGTPPDRDVIPLCCCKINGASFNKLGTAVTYCQALDSVDGKVMGCCNKVSNSQLVRPAVKIPFMAICEVHRKRLRLHQCCPGCGHFCTQGKFFQCRKEGGSSIHHFHKQCQFQKDMKYYCPHCGEESSQFEVTLTLNEPKVMSTTDNKRVTKDQTKAKMGMLKIGISELDHDEEIVTHTLSATNKVLTSAGMLLGPDRYSLEKVLRSLTEDRSKKFKSIPKFFYTPAYEGDLEKVIFMLDEGLDPNEKVEEYDDQTALHAAAINGSLSVVHILVQAGANIHALDKNLKTPLMYAAENDHLSVVKYLVKSGANVRARADDGMTALHLSAKSGCINVIKYLLDSDQVDVNVKDEGGWTAVIWACENKLVKTVRFLLKYGADPNLKDNEENTCLHWAAFSGSVDIAEILLNAKCDMEAPNEHGDRPLHIAARQDHYECIVLLLARGADVECRNNENETPVGCCLDQNSAVCLALKVNKQLKGLAAKRLGRSEKLIHRDITMGRENIPIACVNGVDDELVPEDYQYITENVETSPLHINRVITSLQSCRCKDDCSSQLCVCSRSSVKCWYTREGKLVEDFSMVDPPLLFECNRACRCWTTCNNRVVQNGIVARLQMVRTDGRGWGVKTLLDINKGTFVCEYIGELISDHEADIREDDSYLFDLDNRDGETYCIDARKYGNISRFINHLCEPNLIPVKVFMEHQDLRFPRICFFASKDIKAHEELGFDYGEKFWMIKWKQFTCTCRSEKCKYSKDTIQKTLEDYRQRHGLDDSSMLE